jgi:hypothetical protein
MKNCCKRGIKKKKKVLPKRTENLEELRRLNIRRQGIKILVPGIV